MEKGFDPIRLENKYLEWLKEDKDNIVIYLDDSIKNSERILLLNKNYFLNPTVNDIYKKCIKNNSLLVKETYDSDTYFEILDFILDKYNMINNVDFVGALKKSRCKITLKSVDGNSEFINNQLLELHHK